MSTGRKFVSDVRSMHKLLSTDNLITDRVIFAEIKNNFLFLIKRETNLRRLWATDTLFTTIPCLELIEVPISECSSYVDPIKIARSKFKIPRIAEGNYQYVIQGVYSINANGGKGTKIKGISLNRYLNLLKLRIHKNELYFWISDNYLYVTNPSLQSVRLVAFFEEDVPNEILYPECNCGNKPPTKEWCKNPLDKEFALPGYLAKQVLKLTAESLLSSYFRIHADVSQDSLDESESSQQRTK